MIMTEKESSYKKFKFYLTLPLSLLVRMQSLSLYNLHMGHSEASLQGFLLLFWSGYGNVEEAHKKCRARI